MVKETLLPSWDVPWYLPVRDRLRSVAGSLLRHALSPDAVALMRVCVTTAHRMPELARQVDRVGRDGGMACIVRALAGNVVPADKAQKASDVAGRFIDMVFVPQQMRALIGDDCENLDQAALRRIDDTIDLFDRAGLLDFFETPPGSHTPLGSVDKA
ncbi:TetR/AcrR family transcriptional regulator C-terminal domain-containing protein [Gluconobacter thailandicus]|nr:TetR/AcrR family transcriptional regulator C-terminal domain-containing protein [Gluconobacter thailandicus]